MQVDDVAPAQPDASQIGPAALGRRRRALRWNPERCIPLVVLAWILGGLAISPMLIYLFKGVIW